MLHRLVAAAAAVLCAATFSLPASAESVDASAFTCKELTDSLASDDKDSAYGASVLLAWFAGYHATDEQGTVVDFDNLKLDTDKIINFCAGNPGIGVMSAASKFMGENATPATKEAVDIATLKCERLANSTEADAEGVGFILMWLAGYYASYAEETMIDFEELDRQSTEIGKTCASKLQMGLVTAARKVMYVE